MKQEALKAAFPKTLPVLFGYVFLGIAFGVILSSKGYGLEWALALSLFVYAGSMQFVAVNLLNSAFDPLSVAIITLLVNARHLFYGLSMLELFKNTGKLKSYLIFSLTDETYSLHCSSSCPAGVDQKWYLFFTSLLNHIYWIIGSVIGSVVGSLLQFNSTGIDFALTALFLVIFIEQWEKTKDHLPALLGLFATLLCLVLFGSTWFIVAAMFVILAGFFLLYNIEGRDKYDQL